MYVDKCMILHPLFLQQVHIKYSTDISNTSIPNNDKRLNFHYSMYQYSLKLFVSLESFEL